MASTTDNTVPSDMIQLSRYIHHQADSKSIKLRVATSNIGSGTYEPIMDTERLNKHLADWKEIKPDILALQEVRRYPMSTTTENKEVIQPDDIQYALGKMGYGVASTCEDDVRSRYANWIAYNREKLQVGRQTSYWLGRDGSFTTVPGGNACTSTPECRGFSSCANVVEFYHLVNTGITDTIKNGPEFKLIHAKSVDRLPKLMVINIHWPTDYNVKQECGKATMNLLKMVTKGFTVPFILLGDFNSFPQDPVSVMTVFKEVIRLKDVINLVGKDGRKVQGTWSGYPSRDPFFKEKKNPPVTYPDGMIHHMDHIIYDPFFVQLLPSSPSISDPHGVVHTDEERVRNETGPSDHCLVHALFDVSIDYLDGLVPW